MPGREPTMAMPGAIVSKGEDVTLRTVEEEDRAFCQRASANPEIRVPIGNPVRSRSELGDVTEKDDGDQFLVCLDDEDVCRGSPDEDETTRIGWVGVDDVSYRRPDLSYWLAPEFQGEGYGTEAVALLIEYTFATYDHPAVGAIAYDFNDASRELLASLGFEEEGRIRRDWFIDGEYVDTIHYGLLREDWWDQ
jgi:RimJ/RimL family protein N-acetyltransferase